MTQHLSRAAQRMIATVLQAHDLRIEKDRVIVGPITFLLNQRAIGLLNEQAFQNKGQYGTPRGVLEAPASFPSPEPGESPGPRSTDGPGCDGIGGSGSGFRHR